MFRENSSHQTLALRAVVVAILILFAAALRIAPHPWNFTPMGAMALFSGAMFRDRRVAYLFPLLALFAGDLFIGFHRLMPVVYISFLIQVSIGTWLANRSGILRVGLGVFLGALQFFLITNFAVWRVFESYPHTATGLLACYAAGLPFFGNTLLGDAFYSAVLFGGFVLAEKLCPALREQATPIAA